MPRLDTLHEVVKRALQKKGWIITDDPYELKVGKRSLYVDLGAERLISAEKDNQKIAVEIKSFSGASDVRNLEEALGQFMLYHKVIARYEPERKLYLAVNEWTFQGIFSEEIGQIVLADPTFSLCVFDDEKEVIIQWIPQP